eukprot:3596440-Pleurochrysis_carterae.AAC.1
MHAARALPWLFTLVTRVSKARLRALGSYWETVAVAPGNLALEPFVTAIFYRARCFLSTQFLWSICGAQILRLRTRSSM